MLDILSAENNKKKYNNKITRKNNKKVLTYFV